MQSEAIRSYYTLYEGAETPLLYTAPWWLDATCGPGGWGVVIKYGAKGIPMAGLPYHLTRIRGLSAVITPPLTQWVSLLTSPQYTDVFDRSFLHELPKSSILDLTLKPDTDLLIQDSAYPVNLKYSFIIPHGQPMDLVRSGYNEGLRRNLKQAEKKYAIRESDDISAFLSLCEQTYLQRKMNPPFWLKKVVPGVIRGLMANECGALMVATLQGKVIAGVLFAWDHNTGYYLAGGRTGDEQGASAHALLLDHAIQTMLQRGLTFDFEGSMHPGIANFFQSFGAVPISFWQVRKFRGIGKLWALFH